MNKNKITAVGLGLTIFLPMALMLYGNLTGLPEDQLLWDVTTTLLAIGIFLVTPLAMIRLFRSN